MKLAACCVYSLSLMLLSCNVNVDHRSNKGSTSDRSIGKETLAEKFTGTWLSDEYLSSVKKKQSVFTSNDSSSTWFGFTLQKEDLLQEKSFLNGFTVNEGGYGTEIRFDKQSGIIEGLVNRSSQMDKSFRMELASDSLVDFIFKPSGKVERYRKVDDIEYALNDILMKGQYKDERTGQSIIFTRDGKVSGIEGMDHFLLLYQFGEGLYFDVVFFWYGSDRTNEKVFHYNIKGDTLLLSPVNGELPDYSIGEVAYTLVKQ